LQNGTKSGQKIRPRRVEFRRFLISVARLHFVGVAVIPESAESCYNLALALQEQGRVEEAVACYRRALVLNPAFAEAHNNLGNILWQDGTLDEAVACFHRALECKPDFAEAHCNLGAVLQEQGKLVEAAVCYERAIELAPKFAEARWCRSALRLLKGDFERGWPEFEWRFRCQGCSPRQFRQPVWNGGPLAGKTILLYTEQGLGDAIQFVRYARLVTERAARVIVGCENALLPLFTNCTAVDCLVAEGSVLPPFDVHASLMSLPAIFQTTCESIPAAVPYLFADAALVEQWRKSWRAAAATALASIGVAGVRKERFGSEIFPSRSLSGSKRCQACS
jgi:tetratricopeptide (TPR) repeat protein